MRAHPSRERNLKAIWIPALAIVTATALSDRAVAASADVVVRSTHGAFQEVKERVLLAIENRGLVLNYTARIGAMLERTGKDIGSARQVYRDAEMLEFCSAKISRDAMEADPRNIAFCPYSIAVYTLPKEKDRVYLAYRRVGESGTGKSAKALAVVDKLLADIVAEALK
jgi:uncharacterized protein (DUF302 family)